MTFERSSLLGLRKISKNFNRFFCLECYSGHFKKKPFMALQNIFNTCKIQFWCCLLLDAIAKLQCLIIQDWVAWSSLHALTTFTSCSLSEIETAWWTKKIGAGRGLMGRTASCCPLVWCLLVAHTHLCVWRDVRRSWPQVPRGLGRAPARPARTCVCVPYMLLFFLIKSPIFSSPSPLWEARLVWW